MTIQSPNGTIRSSVKLSSQFETGSGLWFAAITGGSLRNVTCQRNSSGHQADQQRSGRIERTAVVRNAKRRRSDRADKCVNGIPDRVEPWDLVRNKFTDKKQTGSRKDRSLSQQMKVLHCGRGLKPAEPDRESEAKTVK